MKVVFLDIDGVINSLDFLHAHHSLTRAKGEQFRRPDEFGDPFDPRCVMHLERLLRETEASIVISSVWRFSGLKEMRFMWWSRKLYGDIVGVTPREPDGFRGREIKKWIEQNPIDRYVILDDDGDMLDEQMGNFVRVDSNVGLTFGDIEKAVAILSPSNSREKGEKG